jgi:hypothetical protein
MVCIDDWASPVINFAIYHPSHQSIVYRLNTKCLVTVANFEISTSSQLHLLHLSQDVQVHRISHGIDEFEEGDMVTLKSSERIIQAQI